MTEKLTLTIYHIVTPDHTTTLLTRDEMKDFAADASDYDVVVCESEVTSEQYDKLSRMRGATS